MRIRFRVLDAYGILRRADHLDRYRRVVRRAFILVRKRHVEGVALLGVFRRGRVHHALGHSYRLALYVQREKRGKVKSV